MVTWFSVILAFVIVQRLGELYLARRNAKYLQCLGGIEAGREHYPLIVGTHIAFFISLLCETYIRRTYVYPPAIPPFALFLAAQGLRIWCILSLGRYWNTRIWFVVGSKPVVRGPYRFLRHPNYLVVVCEIFSLPLSFHAYVTAILFTVCNVMVLRVRIRVEEEALNRYTGYQEEMENRLRFFPSRRR